MRSKSLIDVLGKLSFLLLISSSAVSGGLSTNVEVTKVVTQSANSVGVNRVCVYVSGAINDTPSCNTSIRFCSDIDQSIGRAHLSAALTAYASKKKVNISGLGTCNQVSNSEDINYILLSDQ